MRIHMLVLCTHNTRGKYTVQFVKYLFPRHVTNEDICIYLMMADTGYKSTVSVPMYK